MNPEERARDIVYDIRSSMPMSDPRVRSCEIEEWYEDAIKHVASALRVPANHVRDENGVLYKGKWRKTTAGHGESYVCFWPEEDYTPSLDAKEKP